MEAAAAAAAAGHDPASIHAFTTNQTVNAFTHSVVDCSSESPLWKSTDAARTR